VQDAAEEGDAEDAEHEEDEEEQHDDAHQLREGTHHGLHEALEPCKRCKPSMLRMYIISMSKRF
jgi:hypothetical protein